VDALKFPPEKAAADRTLKLVADLSDFERDPHIGIAKLDDIEQRLLFPRVAARTAIVGAVE
jgi:hypothetical protein